MTRKPVTRKPVTHDPWPVTRDPCFRPAVCQLGIKTATLLNLSRFQALFCMHTTLASVCKFPSLLILGAKHLLSRWFTLVEGVLSDSLL